MSRPKIRGGTNSRIMGTGGGAHIQCPRGQIWNGSQCVFAIHACQKGAFDVTSSWVNYNSGVNCNSGPQACCDAWLMGLFPGSLSTDWYAYDEYSTCPFLDEGDNGRWYEDFQCESFGAYSCCTWGYENSDE